MSQLSIKRHPCMCYVPAAADMPKVKQQCAFTQYDPRPNFEHLELVNWFIVFNVTINNISVIYVTAHRCAGGLKKK